MKLNLKKILRVLVPCTFILASMLARAVPEVGDAAPDFNLLGSDGQYYSLSQYKSEKPVVIAFFPKAFTGG